MIEMVVTNIPVEGWVVFPYIDSLLCGSGQALVLPSYNVEVR